jgi:hypothetical protein
LIECFFCAFSAMNFPSRLKQHVIFIRDGTFLCFHRIKRELRRTTNAVCFKEWTQ